MKKVQGCQINSFKVDVVCVRDSNGTIWLETITGHSRKGLYSAAIMYWGQDETSWDRLS